MAILSGFTTGKARKSAGDITYTRLNGQNIAKAKIMRNPNYKPSPAQLAQRITMAFFGKSMHVLLPAINYVGIKSMYGSKLNAYAKQYKGEAMNVLFGPASLMQDVAGNDASQLKPSTILELFAGENFANLKQMVGTGTNVVLSVTGTSAAAVYALAWADSSQLQVDDVVGVYVYSSDTQTFSSFSQKRIAETLLTSSDIENGFVNIAPTVLSGKYTLAVGVIRRGTQVVSNCEWINTVLAS